LTTTTVSWLVGIAHVPPSMVSPDSFTGSPRSPTAIFSTLPSPET
jgi:hypothetical protein